MTTPRLQPVPFYFLRHGETDWNRQRIMQGHKDIPLNACGIEQAREAISAVAALPVVTICCSTLSRARQTADIVNSKALPIVVIDDLKECGFGIYEGRDAGETWREAWRQGAEIPGGESLVQFTARLVRGLNTALVNPGPVLIVGHGGSIWPLEQVTGIPSGIRIANCTLLKFDPPIPGQDAWSCSLLDEPDSPSVAIGEARVAL